MENEKRQNSSEAGANSRNFFCTFKMQATEEESRNWVRAEETGVLLYCNFNGMSSVSIK